MSEKGTDSDKRERNGGYDVVQEKHSVVTAAQEAIVKAQELLVKSRAGKRRYRPFALGDKVWLEGTNLATTHPSHKLAAKCHGPFKITVVISPVVYQLGIPEQWK